MLIIRNSSTLFIDQINGDDKLYSGLSPAPDGYGNGPYKTVEQALRIIKDLRATGHERPITISFVNDYLLNAPIRIDKTVYDVTIRSFGKRKRIIGGAPITGWKKAEFNGVSCLAADLPKRADGERWAFTDLFVNGQRASVTRYPKKGTLTVIDTEEKKRVDDKGLIGHSRWFIPRPEDIEGIEGIEDATVNFYHFWIDEHSPVESYDKESGIITMRYPSRFSLTAMYEQKAWSDMYYYLSGIPSSFSEAGEWYLDRGVGRVYYIPRCQEEWSSIEAFYPTTDKLLVIESDDITVENLEFTVTACDYESRAVKDPETELLSDGERIFGGDGQSVSCAFGAIDIKNSERVRISGCHIHSLGIYAISLGIGCRHARIEGCRIEDIAAGGIRIYGGSVKAPKETHTSDCYIGFNEICNLGRRYEAGCGILVCHASNNIIENNEIHDSGYSGISVGWVWGYADSLTLGNIIRRNHIYNIGKGNLSDMGGIYLLGKQRGTVVAENRIHDVICQNYGGWGIYLDEGSSYVKVEKNLVYRTGEECFDLHYGSHNLVRNNIFVGLTGHYPVRTSKNELHEEVLFENNLVVSCGSAAYNPGSGANTFTSRGNFFYDMKKDTPILFTSPDGTDLTLPLWQSIYGQDAESRVVTPIFASVEDEDFTLHPDSEIYSLGFEPLPYAVTSKK